MTALASFLTLITLFTQATMLFNLSMKVANPTLSPCSSSVNDVVSMETSPVKIQLNHHSGVSSVANLYLAYCSHHLALVALVGTMQLTISTHDDKVFTIEVYRDHSGYLRHANVSCMPKSSGSRCLCLGCCIQVDSDTEVSTLQAILEAETGLSVEQQNIFHNGRPLPTRLVGMFQNACVTCCLALSHEPCVLYFAVAHSRQRRCKLMIF